MGAAKKKVQRRAQADSGKKGGQRGERESAVKGGASAGVKVAVGAASGASAGGAGAGAGEAAQVLFARRCNELPEPSAALRKGFRLLKSDEECAKLGADTRAVEVLPEAREAFTSAVETITEHGATLRYLPTRLRYAMDVVGELERQFAVQSEREKGGKGRTSAVVLAETEAKAAREALVVGLGPVMSAGGSSAVEGFESARGNLDTKDVLLSLTELIAIGRAWVNSKDEVRVALVEHQGVTSGALTGFDAVAAALAAARDASSAGGAAVGRDLPATNVLEGRVLFEVKALYEAIESNRKSTAIALPKVGATLRRALWQKPKKAAGAKGGAKKPEGGEKGKGEEPKPVK